MDKWLYKHCQITQSILLILISLLVWSCSEPKDPGKAIPNQPPIARLANIPIDDKAIDTTGQTAKWNPLTDDLGIDGLPDTEECFCGWDTTRRYDPITLPDPAFDNYDPFSVDSCTEGYPLKSNKYLYTQNNGRADFGEPNVVKFSPTKTPLVTLYWVGNDADGFVTAFMYRWTYKDSIYAPVTKWHRWTTILNYVTYTNLVLLVDVDSASAPQVAPEIFKYFTNIDLDPERRATDPAITQLFESLERGDTVIVKGRKVVAANPPKNPYPVHESPNSGTFIFESDDRYNYHKFEVMAIDNESAVSEIDSIRFWNRKVEPPLTQILKAPGVEFLYILKEKTHTWQGIEFTFKGIDRNSRTLDYSWRVDNQPWSEWSRSGKALVTAKHIDTPYTGVHVFRVRTRNEFGSITPEALQPTRKFYTIYPSIAEPDYPKRALLVHVTRHFTRDTPREPSTTRVAKYYQSLYDSLNIPYDLWITRGRGHPTLFDLAKYTMVHYFADANTPPDDGANMRITAKHCNSYLDIGGRILFNGVFTSIIGQLFRDPDDREYMDEFLRRRLHIFSFAEGHYVHSRLPTFVGGRGSLGYPDVVLDSAKLDTTYALRGTSVLRPRGFGEIIYRYVANPDTTVYRPPLSFSDLNNKPMGLRYIGISFRTVYLGFPLYYIKKDNAIAVLRKALQDLEHIQ